MGGVRDYELAVDGENIADLTLAKDGSLWLGTFERDGINLISNVIKLAGASLPTTIAKLVELAGRNRRFAGYTYGCFDRD